MDAAVFTASLAYFSILAFYSIELPDAGHLVHQIYRTYQGQTPYADFHSGYAPGLFYWNAALFRLFGPNLLVLRLCLALIHASTIFLMYWLARRLDVSRPAAAAGGLAYLALLPFFDGNFASFNIPYPTWYVTLFWLLSVASLVRWWRTDGALPCLAAGICSGLAFTFKQNSGLFDLATMLIALSVLQRPVLGPAGSKGIARLARVSARLLRWLIPSTLILGLTLTFAKGGGVRLVTIYVLPLIVLVGSHLALPRARMLSRLVTPQQFWRNLLLLGAGFGAVLLPWTLYFWSGLGTMAFLRVALYVGTSYEQFYSIPYPGIGPWDIAVAGVLGLGLALGEAVRRGWVPARLLAIGAGLTVVAGGALLVHSPPPMVEGFQRSVVMRVTAVTIPVLLLVQWTAILVYLARVGRRWSKRSMAGFVDPADATPAHPPSAERSVYRNGVLFILSSSAVLMYMQLYPRSDFMHAVVAAPGILILSGWVVGLTAHVWAQAIASSRSSRRWVRSAIVAPVYLVAAILLAPAVQRIGYLMSSWWRADNAAIVRLDTPRAPFVREAAAGAPLASLSALIHYVQERTDPGEYVFTFPCLDMLAFLMDRPDPTRHGYYYPGSPGHSVEAEVIDALRARRPRYVIALQDHALFFVGAPIYYFNLREHVTRHYELERSIGPFGVLRRKDLPDPASVITTQTGGEVDDLARTVEAWRIDLGYRISAAAGRAGRALAALPAPTVEALADAIEGLDPAAQRVVVDLIRRSRSRAGVATLATVLARGSLPEASHQLFVRTVSELGDASAVAPLLEGLHASSKSRRMDFAGNLFTIAFKTWLQGYWLAPVDLGEIRVTRTTLSDAQLIGWFDNPWEAPALRSFAIRFAGLLEREIAAPFLVRVMGDANEMIELRVEAAHSLVELGFGVRFFPIIADLLQRDIGVPATLILRLYPEAPEQGAALIARQINTFNPWARATAYWLAAGLGDPALAAELLAGLEDPSPEIRMAAAWGLGNVGDPASMPALQRASGDPHDEVRAFAERAVKRIEQIALAQPGGAGQ